MKATAAGETTNYTGYPVQIFCFTGPLDLLLHLVRAHEVDIAEVPVAEVTGQYLEYLRTMQEINVELSGEFLITAAALSYVKSKTLLPPEPETEEEPEATEDPAVELQRRLAQYHIYKEAATRLDTAKRLRERIFLRPLSEDSGVESGFVTLQDVSLFDMVGAVSDMLKRAVPEPMGRVVLPRLTVPDRIEEIRLRLRTEREEFSFSQLVGEVASRAAIIVTFLALLEMMRRQEVEVRQEAPRGEIMVRAVQTPLPGATVTADVPPEAEIESGPEA
ncbi:MAG TPA: segregation/condensation protein A [Armatimonadota bacterium]|jgi:segregation and condensation protein A